MPGAGGSKNTNQNSGQGSRECPVITLNNHKTTNAYLTGYSINPKKAKNQCRNQGENVNKTNTGNTGKGEVRNTVWKSVTTRLDTTPPLRR
jgi:hypothetical protein